MPFRNNRGMNGDNVRVRRRGRRRTKRSRSFSPGSGSGSVNSSPRGCSWGDGSSNNDNGISRRVRRSRGWHSHGVVNAQQEPSRLAMATAMNSSLSNVGNQKLQKGSYESSRGTTSNIRPEDIFNSEFENWDSASGIDIPDGSVQLKTKEILRSQGPEHRRRSRSPLPHNRLTLSDGHHKPHRPRTPSPITKRCRIRSTQPRSSRKSYDNPNPSIYNTSDENWDEGLDVKVKNERSSISYDLEQPPLPNRSCNSTMNSRIKTIEPTAIDKAILNTEFENWDVDVKPNASEGKPDLKNDWAGLNVKIKKERVDEPEPKYTKIGNVDTAHLPSVHEAGEIEPGEATPSPPPSPSCSQMQRRSFSPRPFRSSFPSPDRSSSRPSQPYGRNPSPARHSRYSISPEPLVPRTVRRSVNDLNYHPEPRRKQYSNSDRDREQKPAGRSLTPPTPQDKPFCKPRRPYQKTQSIYGFDMNLGPDKDSELILPPPPPIPKSSPPPVYSTPMVPLSQLNSQGTALYNMAALGFGPLGLLPHQIATLLPHQIAVLAQLVPMQVQLQGQQLNLPMQVPIVPQISIPNPATTTTLISSAIPGANGVSTIKRSPHGSDLSGFSAGNLKRDFRYSTTIQKREDSEAEFVPRRVSATAKFNGDDENWETETPNSARIGRQNGNDVKGFAGHVNNSAASTTNMLVRENAVVFDYGHGSNGFSF